MIRRLLPLLCSLSLACNIPVEVGGDGGAEDAGGLPPDSGVPPASSPVTLGGYTLQPRSSAMHSSLIGGTPDSGVGGAGLVAVISDHGDFCSTIGGCTVTYPEWPAGTHLEILITGTELAVHPVGTKSALRFLKRDSSGLTVFREEAGSGAVTLTAYDPQGWVVGSYDVTMKGGAVLQGTFAARWCPALGLNLPGGGVTCTSSAGGSPGAATCSIGCSCEGRSVSASCNQTGTDSYSCTCTSPSGQVTTCTMTGLQGASACAPYETCCPLAY